MKFKNQKSEPSSVEKPKMQQTQNSQQQIVNYQEELRQLRDTAQFWKPTIGKHELTILSEPEECEFTKDGGEVLKQWKMTIRLKGGETQFIWTVPKSYAPTSVRGQLVKLGCKNGNKLTGCSLSLIVMGEGKSRRYTIPEAI